MGWTVAVWNSNGRAKTGRKPKGEAGWIWSHRKSRGGCQRYDIGSVLICEIQAMSPHSLLLDVPRVRCPKSRRGERIGYAMMNRPYCPGPFLERGLIPLVHYYFVAYIFSLLLFSEWKDLTVNLTIKYPIIYLTARF